MLIIADTGALISLGHIDKLYLIEAKNRKLIEQLKPLFEKWLTSNRYFSKYFLNLILAKFGEEKIL